MHKLTVFNLSFNGGNADCSRIDLENGRKILVDYAYETGAENSDGLGVDLPAKLRQDLKDNRRNHFDVACFTHLDFEALLLMGRQVLGADLEEKVLEIAHSTRSME